jgi:ABC-2 type transport system permease protein
VNKVALIIKREYLTRIRKKSFLIMTVLGPLLTGGLITAVVYLSSIDNEHRTVVVIDDSHQFEQKFKDDENTSFVYLNTSLDSLRSKSKKDYFGILHIPASTNKPTELERTTTFYSEKQPSFDLLEKIKFTMEKEINSMKYAAAGIDSKKLEEIKTNVQIKTRDLENNETSTPLKTIVGFVCGILVYFFTFLYGVQVMRGIMEEKMNRIVEVIISSVKPFQLMMGKIIGIALVGLTQFLLWIILSGVVYGTLMSGAMKDKSTNQKLETMMKEKHSQNFSDEASTSADKANLAKQVSDAMGQINFPLIIGLFIFYFLGGYLLYAALFAAIGSAVDAETDTQQFMFPITIPLILAYVASINVINNPDGPLGFWFSQIPFTSPIVMMVRIPIGVSIPQVLSSMAFLILGFLFTTWLASKIYRTGILMYGKKVNYAELWKWIRYSS